MISLNTMMLIFRSIKEINMFGLHLFSIVVGAVVGAVVPVVGNFIRKQWAWGKTKAASVEAKLANTVSTVVSSVENKL